MIYKKCPRCGADLIQTNTIKGNKSQFWLECSNVYCGAMVDNFEPYNMQYNFLEDDHSIKAVFGGFASGKSISVIKDVQKHILITPNAYVAIIGNTYPLIERNFKKDFDEDFPERFMKKTQGQKEAGYQVQKKLYTLKNGAQIELITSDDAKKIRGLNATKVVLLEASNIDFEIFNSVKSRLRNSAANKYLEDENGNVVFRLDKKTGLEVPVITHSWHNMLLESNPENNWIKIKFLLMSEKVNFYGSSYNKYNYILNNINDDYSAHISATDGNPYLPPNYLEINTRGKPEHEIKRFYYGSFEFSENMVLPEIVKCYVDDYPLDLNDPNIFVGIGIDYGIYDTAAFTFWAWDFKKHLLIVFLTFGGRDLSIKAQAELFRKHFSIIPDGKLLMLPQMDGKSFGKRQADLKTIGEMFEDAGLLFEGAFEVPLVRITKMKALSDNGQIHIFRQGAKDLIEELNNWKWKIDRRGNVLQEPVDKDNHYIDSLGFSLIKLPMDLSKMKVFDYIKPGQKITVDFKKNKPTVTYTERQKMVISLNPLNMNYEEKQNDTDLSDEEYDLVISKLSGV